jgi:hypothetical protein
MSVQGSNAKVRTRAGDVRYCFDKPTFEPETSLLVLPCRSPKRRMKVKKRQKEPNFMQQTQPCIGQGRGTERAFEETIPRGSPSATSKCAYVGS